MKILTVNGSPRKGGNSATLAARFDEAARTLGAEIVEYTLNDLEYRGCQACDGCRTGETPCILDDDLADVLEAVHDADVLVLATPVYFGDVSAQMKGFIDRTRSFLKPDFRTQPVPGRLAPGKEVVFLLSQAEDDPGKHEDVFPRYEHFFRYFNFARAHVVRACGVHERGEVSGKTDAVHEVEKLAREIVERS